MVDFEKFVLPNGLRLIVHRDTTTPIVAMNLLYHVGAKDEDQEKTGFAHLFEHLMFEGSVNIARFDEELEKAGGQNNAFTTNDITNFYLSVPKQNLETAFWLESDRMLGLDLTHEKVSIQKQVVIEEFRQRYLNQPYGDLWKLIRSLAYKVHPYRWPTIGMDISHIERAEHADIESFYETHYSPANAILCIAGDVKAEEIFKLAEKWFGQVRRPYTYTRNLPEEPVQQEKRLETVHRDVPMPAIYKVFHSCKRNHPDYIISDMISDLFSRGDSSRLYQELVKKQQLFADISSFVSGETESGLMVAGGKINRHVSPEKAEKALADEISKLAEKAVPDKELEKIKNQVETSQKFSEMKAQEKAMNLCFYELLGDASIWNEENRRIRAVTPGDILSVSRDIFREEKSSTLIYLSDNCKPDNFQTTPCV